MNPSVGGQVTHSNVTALRHEGVGASHCGWIELEDGSDVG